MRMNLKKGCMRIGKLHKNLFMEPKSRRLFIVKEYIPPALYGTEDIIYRLNRENKLEEIEYGGTKK